MGGWVGQPRDQACACTRGTHGLLIGGRGSALRVFDPPPACSMVERVGGCGVRGDVAAALATAPSWGPACRRHAAVAAVCWDRDGGTVTLWYPRLHCLRNVLAGQGALSCVTLGSLTGRRGLNRSWGDSTREGPQHAHFFQVALGSSRQGALQQVRQASGAMACVQVAASVVWRRAAPPRGPPCQWQ